MDEKTRFTLTLSKAESDAFRAECRRRGTGRTTVLRSFIRQWMKIGGADFAVVPIEQLALREIQ